MTIERVALIVLDGLGVGAMPDAPHSDRDSHTLRHVIEAAGGLDVPNMTRLGLGRTAGLETALRDNGEISGAFGVARLGYPGADTYLGHQELMGAPAAHVHLHMLAERLERVVRRLERDGHHVVTGRHGTSVLLVDDHAVVADNIEAAPGLNVNVTGSLDEVGFDHLLEIGRSIREEVSLPRVIVVAGRGFSTDQILASLTERAPGHIGVDTPRLGTYDENYVVRHLGFARPTDTSLPERIAAADGAVVLLGKAADVVEADVAERSNDIPTDAVLSATVARLDDGFRGLIVANIQETDLAGHEQDPVRFRTVLEMVDEWLPRVLERLSDRGVLFVTGDHGNDPALGTSRHTREYVPLLVGGRFVRPQDLGIRSSLGDVAATIVDLIGAGSVAQGVSFAHAIGSPAASTKGIGEGSSLV